jgi:hypothetical protein
MEEMDREWAAFKIYQSKLEEEVSTVTISLTKLTEDIMSANKRGRKQRKHKDTEATSASSADQGGGTLMEGYDKIAHDMETSWDSMFESEREKEDLTRKSNTQT